MNNKVDKITIGYLFRFKSFWIGCHYSDECRRFCINVIPCLTILVVFSGGKIPKIGDK